MASTRSDFLSGAAVRLLSVAAMFIAGRTLATMMGPREYGAYSSALSTLMVICVPLTLGSPTLVLRETANCVTEGQPARARVVLRWAIKRVGISTLLGCAVAFLCLQAISGMQLGKAEVISLGLPIVFLHPLSALRGASIRGFGSVVMGTLPDQVLRPTVVALSVVYLSSSGATVTAQRGMAAMVLASLISFSVGLAWLWYLFARDSKENSACASNTRQSGEQSRTWSSAVKNLAVVGAAMTLLQQADMVSMGFLADDSETGIYKVAITLAALGLIPRTISTLVAGPHIVKLNKAGDPAVLGRYLGRVSSINLLASVVCGIGFLAFGEKVITVIYGNDYVKANACVVLLAFGYAVASAFGMGMTVLAMLGHERYLAKFTTAMLIANVGLNYLLIPKYGGLGAATSTAIVQIVLSARSRSVVRALTGSESAFFATLFKA